ncbi:MAG TPA: hypothetical protein VII72_08400 [Myxococcota bacterium]
MIREKVVRFGKSTPLVGIASEPPALALAPAKPAVLLLNSGILHRVGACRFHVTLARRLAEMGFPTLRFDFSGIGDSEVRRDDLPFERSAIVEVREGMDHLATSRGVKQFVLFGLCSGADMAFEAAHADERVVGLAVLDPWVYRTPRYFVQHYGPRLLVPSAWANFVRARVARGRAASPEPGAEGGLPEDLDLPTYVREFPPREASEQRLRGLVARGMRLCTIFSGGQSDHYNYRGQFRDAFRGVDFGDQLQEEYLPEADHIFTNLEHQRILESTLCAWADAGWTAAGQAPRGARGPVLAPAPAAPAA